MDVIKNRKIQKAKTTANQQSSVKTAQVCTSHYEKLWQKIQHTSFY